MNKEIEATEMQALILSELKKLVKHFKLDRRKQGDDSADSESAPESDNDTLQTIAAVVKEISERKLFTEEQIASLNRIVTGIGNYFYYGNNERHTELKSLLEVIIKKLDEQPTEPLTTTIRREHHFSIDFKNSKAALTMITMGFVILISLGCNIYQAKRNNALRENDIKYRYVKMQGKASSEEFYRLESIFEYDRNIDSVRLIRRQVEQYEQLVKEQAENEARIRLNNERSEQTLQKIEIKKKLKNIKFGQTIFYVYIVATTLTLF